MYGECVFDVCRAVDLADVYDELFCLASVESVGDVWCSDELFCYV